MKKITNLILAIAVIMTLQNTTNAIQTKAVAEQTQINQNTAKQAKIMTDEVANSSFDKKLFSNFKSEKKKIKEILMRPSTSCVTFSRIPIKGILISSSKRKKIIYNNLESSWKFQGSRFASVSTQVSLFHQCH